MANFNIGTGSEQPINRTGLDNIQIQGDDVQGTLVGVDNSVDPPELVEADAGSGSQIQAIGVLFPQEVFPDDEYSYVGSHELTEELAQMYSEMDRTEVGERVTLVRYGVEMLNDGADMDLTPGEPVYLAPGGGFTQTKPSGSGEIVQVLGVALDPEDMGPTIGDGRERILLDIEADYETLA
jgi:hypothetical protein